jgi:DNA-binding NtrC family response regulator
VPVNCAALPDTLLESELFGHRAGAFTDARRDYVGRFARADGGTLFLDEIGDMSPALQVKLLRVLQDRVIEPLGSTAPVSVDVRVVTATNRNLAELVRRGVFRQDLYYRIRVVHLQLPPLAQRREDIPLLVDHMVAKFNHLQGKDVAGVSEDAMARLMAHEFPGNVRELENIIEQAFVLCRGGMIEPHQLPSELRPNDSAASKAVASSDLLGMEKRLIEDTLRRCKGNRKRSARALGIDVSTLYRKIKSFRIDVPETDGRHRR